MSGETWTQQEKLQAARDAVAANPLSYVHQAVLAQELDAENAALRAQLAVVVQERDAAYVERLEEVVEAAREIVQHRALSVFCGEAFTYLDDSEDNNVELTYRFMDAEWEHGRRQKLADNKMIEALASLDALAAKEAQSCQAEQK